MTIEFIKVEENENLKLSIWEKLSQAFIDKKVRTVENEGVIDSIIIESRKYYDERYIVKFYDVFEVIVLHLEFMQKVDCLMIIDYNGNDTESKNLTVRTRRVGYHQYP